MNTEDRLKELTHAARAESIATEAEWNDFSRRAHRSLIVRRAVTATGALALIAIVAFSAVVMASGDSNDRSFQPVTPPNETDEGEVISVPASEFELWFVRDDRLSWGSTSKGGELPAELAGDDSVAQLAAYWLNLLLDGPPGSVQEVGDTSAIPDGTELLGVSRDDSVLNVDVSSRFEFGGSQGSMRLRFGQLVYTGTQFEGVEAVRILIDGERTDSIGGVNVSEPLTRRDFEDVAPLIVVESPRSGAEAAGSVAVSGFANVFEGTVNIVVLDRNGEVVGEDFTTATCGSGCWGDFSTEVAFDIAERQRGRVEVFTYSAEDGSEQDVVSIPMILVP